MGVPFPNMKITNDKPTRTSNAVPINSDMYKPQGLRLGDNSVMSESPAEWLRSS